MSIHVVTLMHTGTHLLQAILNHEQRFQGPNRLVRYHTDQVHDHDPADADFMFSSLRHPRRVAESWRRRLEAGREVHTTDFLYEQFDKLIDYFDQHIDLYIHMDAPEVRDSEVQAVGDLIGHRLGPVQWDKADRDTGCLYHTHDIDIEDCPFVPAKYEDFYFSTMVRLTEF